jgi:hydroxymethylpyrimidine pyrophosphatase-like HAD family hydrolase
MRYHALATDYDGTLANDGVPAPEALEALRALRASGRRSIMVTGRLLPDLQSVFAELELFDAIVAENGAVLYDPATRELSALAAPPPPEFVAALRAKNIQPLDVGTVIVSTWHPHENVVLETIRELGLDLTVTFNKGAVMVLPSHVNKASGLGEQVARMGFSLHNVAGIGDAENDLPFLAICEASAATANALESAKNVCDIVTRHDHGRGVAEFIDQILADDLAGCAPVGRRHAVALGHVDGADVVDVPAACSGVLLCGTSGGGKTTLVTGFVERLAEQGYQFCIVDPEGDYEGIAGAIPAGDAQRTPNLDHIGDVMRAGKSMVVSLLAVAQADRPGFAHQLFARIADVHAAGGRPHWLIVDEAHHALPPESELGPIDPGPSLFMITTKPDLIAPAALAAIDVVIAVGDDPGATIASAQSILGRPGAAEPVALEHAHSGTAVVWKRSDPGRERIIEVIPPRGEHRRHVRKYAVGELAPEKSFYFTGAERTQNLRAHNLVTFIQLADGVDDATWAHHRAANDYSRWIHDAIGDDGLSEAIRFVEDDAGRDSRDSRDAVIAAIRERYTAPA